MDKPAGLFHVDDGAYRLVQGEAPRKLRHVTIEITTWCNLRCSGCLRTIGMNAGTWNNKHMSVEDFETIVGHLPPSEVGILHGIGEPTFHPRYLEIISIAAKSGKFTRLHCNTNALARHVDFYAEMVRRGISSFCVSIDSLSPEVAEVTRGGTDTARLLKRVVDFAKLKLPFYVQMVVSRHNLEDIFVTLRTLNESGPLSVAIQSYIDHDERTIGLNRQEALGFISRLNEAKPGLSRLSISVSGFKHLGIVAAQSDLPLCTSPWLDPGVTVEGYLTPCCVEWDPDVLGRISLLATSFSEAWKTPGFQKFLASYIGKDPAFCRNCSQNVREHADADGELVVLPGLAGGVQLPSRSGAAREKVRRITVAIRNLVTRRPS